MLMLPVASWPQRPPELQKMNLRMRAVTSRKCCGSCRFFEASTVQSHGWCRNQHYEGRDDAVLLRAEELGCRSGWQKDHWQARVGAAADLTISVAGTSVDQAAVLPIGQGFSTLLSPDTEGAIVKTPLAATKPATPSFPAGRRRPSQQPGLASAAAPASTLDSSSVSNLEGHPELGANGEMIRRPSRSVVAEAHRKALQRRESERDTATVRRQEQLEAAVSTMYQQGNGSDDIAKEQPQAAAAESSRPLQSVRPTIPVAPAAPLPAAREEYVAPLRATLEPPSPTLPPATPNEGLDRSIAPDRPIAADRTMMPAVRAPLYADLGSKPMREEPALRPAVSPPADDVEAPLARTPRRISTPLPVAPVTTPVEAAAPPADVRYWDQPGANGRFARMRQELTEPVLPRTNVPNVHSAETLPGVPTVGRLNAEPSPLPLEAPGGRTIRPLQPLSTFSAETTENVVSVTRPPRAVAPPEPRIIEPIKPTLPPRQVDGELLKQIRESWRERALAEHAGQRCGTCRFFQSAEGAERGTCGCTFATNSYRQALSRTDLGCLDSLGGWWAATDDGWLQKTDIGSRQQTPLLDQLLAEMGGAEAISAINERRRGTR